MKVNGIRGASLLAGLSVLGILALMLWELVQSAYPAWAAFGWAFIGESVWDPVAAEFGALPVLYGTVVSSLLALAVAVPISLGIAAYLSEVAPPWVVGPVSAMVELLAAIPSVVFGLWGVFVLVPLVRSLEIWLGRWFGSVPLFQGPPYGFGMLAGGLILAIMIVPTITAISRDVLRAVPAAQREAALALGATRWEMIRTTVFAYGKTGIIGAVMLGFGRALGETMAVTMVIGNQPQISASLFAPGQTMASLIANEFNEATGPLHLAALIAAGLVLFAVTVLLQAAARLLVWRVERRQGVRG